MNILYLSEPDPRMTHFGGAQRTNCIWRALQKVGDVYTMTFDQRFETEEVAPRLWYVKKIQKVNPIRDFFYKIQTHIFKTFKVLYCFPLATKIEKYPEELFPGVKFDVVVCRYLDTLAEMHLWGHPHLFVDADDDPMQMYQTVRSQKVQSWLRPLGQWILRQQLAFLQSKVRAVWMSNPADTSRLSMNVPVIPLRNIARNPSANYLIDAPRQMQLLTVGAMSYSPNYDGVDRFLTQVWPSVYEQFPAMQILIVGSGTPEALVVRWSRLPGVRLLGFVENLEALYESCLATVVSVYAGGGTCIKTLESLSHARVCLCSPFGARGLADETELKHAGVFVYRSAEEFVCLLRQQVVNVTQRAENERNTRKYIDCQCSEVAFAQTVAETFEKYAK